MKRKSFLQLLGASIAVTACSPSSITTAGVSSKKRSLRVAHLTDVHVEPVGPSAKGFEKALQSVQSLQPKPDIIFNGGDAIYDSLSRSKAATKAQYELWHQVLKSENSLPLIHCIGNHDVWGWGKKDNREITEDKRYGKQWAVEEFGLPNRYYSFDRAGWHFIVLDSTHHHERFAYAARLDEQQLEWLKNDLQQVKKEMPVAILSHIPLLSFSTQFFNGENRHDPVKLEWERRALMHQDAWAIKNLLLQYKNVKLCMAGHLHMQEELNYSGIKYLVNGAVSGNWWKGSFHEFKPVYAVVDLFQDGTSVHHWVEY